MVTREARLGGCTSRNSVQQMRTCVLQNVYHAPRLKSQCIARFQTPPHVYERCGSNLVRRKMRMSRLGLREHFTNHRLPTLKTTMFPPRLLFNKNQVNFESQRMSGCSQVEHASLL